MGKQENTGRDAWVCTRLQAYRGKGAGELHLNTSYATGVQVQGQTGKWVQGTKAHEHKGREAEGTGAEVGPREHKGWGMSFCRGLMGHYL